MPSPANRPEDNPMRCRLNTVMLGMAGYRIKQYAKNYNIPESVAAKEIMLEGLKALGLLPKNYSLSDMRKGA